MALPLFAKKLRPNRIHQTYTIRLSWAALLVVGYPVWMSQIPGEQANRVDSAKALFFAVFDSSTILKNP